MNDATDMVVLSLEGVSKYFGPIKALEDVSLSVRAGEVHGLIGENGAGKSTLMGVASGALQATAGQLTLCGEVVGADPQRIRDMGLAIVRQEPLLMPDLSVAENIWLSLPQRLRPPVAAMAEFAKAAIARWGADTKIDVGQRVETLNAERRFIVEIVKALAADLKVLVLDEPTEHLAAEDVDRLFGHVRRLAAEGTAVVYISHRIREVQAIADRLTVLRDGKAIQTRDATGLSE